MADPITCPPGTTPTPVTTPGGGTAIACIGHVEVTCELPKVKVCKPRTPPEPVCQCETPTPPPVTAMACQVSIIYPQNDPANPSVLPMGSWCDGAGAELAVAVVLARMLGGPR